MLYNTRHMAEIFSISPSTVKKYAGIYGRVLSDHARPTAGSHRLFDTEDLRVFSYIVAQLKIGGRHDDILASLINGARGDLPTNHSDYTLAMEKGEQVSLLQVRIAQLEETIDELRSHIVVLEAEKERRIEAEGQVKLLRDMIRELMGKG